jgi:hypothetical protein
MLSVVPAQNQFAIFFHRHKFDRETLGRRIFFPLISSVQYKNAGVRDRLNKHDSRLGMTFYHKNKKKTFFVFPPYF